MDLVVTRKATGFNDSHHCYGCKKRVVDELGRFKCGNIICLSGEYFETNCEEYEAKNKG